MKKIYEYLLQAVSGTDMRHFAIPKGDIETHTHTLGETRGKTKLKGVYVCCDSQL